MGNLFDAFAMKYKETIMTSSSRVFNISLKGKDFLKIADFSSEELEYLLHLSAYLKDSNKKGTEKQYLKGKKFSLIFEKDSTRTRCAFETAAFDQGAQAVYLGPSGSQVGKKESMADTARVLSRMFHAIEYRGFGQNLVEELARYSDVPVWNGLTNESHPTQILADFLTMREHCEKPFSEMTFAYLGDSRFNMANSLMIGAAKLGMDFRIIAPKSLQPEDNIVELARIFAQQSGGKIMITDDVATGVLNCDFLYTDVWVSMGEPAEVWKERIELLLPYQVNSKAMELTKNPHCKFLHCLPAFHDRNTTVGEDIYQQYGLDALEVTDEVFESKASLVFDEAENRMHTIKAVMVATLCDVSEMDIKQNYI